jgi:hypothetical protein
MRSQFTLTGSNAHSSVGATPQQSTRENVSIYTAKEKIIIFDEIRTVSLPDSPGGERPHHPKDKHRSASNLTRQ